MEAFSAHVLKGLSLRKMAGYVVQRIEEAQAFLEKWIYTEEGKLPAKFQRMITRVNTYMMPWVMTLAYMMRGHTFDLLRKWWETEGRGVPKASISTLRPI